MLSATTTRCLSEPTLVDEDVLGRGQQPQVAD